MTGYHKNIVNTSII